MTVFFFQLPPGDMLLFILILKGEEGRKKIKKKINVSEKHPLVASVYRPNL